MPNNVDVVNGILDSLGKITEKNQLLRDSNEELKTIMNKIKNSWKSTGTDKETFDEEIFNQIAKIESLGEILNSLKTTLNDYVNELMASSSKGL